MLNPETSDPIADHNRTPPGGQPAAAFPEGYVFPDTPLDAAQPEILAAVDQLLQWLVSATTDRAETVLARAIAVQREEAKWDVVIETKTRHIESLVRVLRTYAPHVNRYGKKSRALPHGIVGSRTLRPRIDITDIAKLRAWAEQHIDAQRDHDSRIVEREEVEKIRKAAIARLVAAEIVPDGVAVSAPTERVYATLANGETVIVEDVEERPIDESTEGDT